MKRLWLLVLFLAFACLPAPVRADTEPVLLKAVGACESRELCSAQTATGDCTVEPAGGDEIVLKVFGKYSSLTFFSNESVGAPYACGGHGNRGGHDLESGDFVLLTSTALSDVNESLSLNGGNFGHIWINCSAITTSVTVTVNACPANR